jgi:hypothetical protein
MLRTFADADLKEFLPALRFVDSVKAAAAGRMPAVKIEESKLPDEVIRKLASLAGARYFEAFGKCARFVERRYSRVDYVLPDKFYRRDITHPIRVLQRSTRELRERLKRLGGVTGLMLDSAISIRSRNEGDHPWSLPRYLEMLRSLDHAAADVLRDAKSFKVRGRPRVRAKTNFIAEFAFAALAAGGNWSLDNNKRTGSLIDGIEIIRPYLASGLLPNAHPVGTYHRELVAARRSWDTMLRCGVLDQKYHSAAPKK